MKIIITESQLKKIKEGLLSNFIKSTTKNTVNNTKNFIKNLGKTATKIDVVKPLMDTLEQIKLQKDNLIKKGVKVLNQKELPRKFYHGSSKKISFGDLTTSAAEKSRVKHTTGSSGMDGMYFAENLWDSMSIYNKYKNPVYTQGEKTVGAESAEKYAKMGFKNGQKGYIYEMELTPDAIIIPEDAMSGINAARINDEDMKKLLSMGIDGIYRSKNEIVILNKRAIKSFNLKYTGDKFVGNLKKNSFGDKIPVEGSFGFNWKPV